MKKYLSSKLKPKNEGRTVLKNVKRHSFGPVRQCVFDSETANMEDVQAFVNKGFS